MNTVAEHKGTDWLVKRYEISVDRFIKNEKFLIKLAELPLWQRIFIRKRIISHLKNVIGMT